MRPDFFQVASGSDGAIGQNHEMIADGSKIAIVTGAKRFSAMKPARFMPLVDIARGEPLTVGCGCAVNDDALYGTIHRPSMAWPGAFVQERGLCYKIRLESKKKGGENG